MLYLAVQDRYICVDRLPDGFVVDLEVTMCDSVAHLVCEGQRQLGMLCRKFRVMLQDVVAGLADNFQIADNGVSCTSPLCRNASSSISSV